MKRNDTEVVKSFKERKLTAKGYRLVNRVVAITGVTNYTPEWRKLNKVVLKTIWTIIDNEPLISYKDLKLKLNNIANRNLK